MKLRKLKTLLAAVLVFTLPFTGSLTVLAESAREIIEQDTDEELPKESTEEEKELEEEKEPEEDEEEKESEDGKEEELPANEEMLQEPDGRVLLRQGARAVLPISTYDGLEDALENADTDQVILINTSFSWEGEPLSIEKNLTIASAGDTEIKLTSSLVRHFKVADGVTVTFDNVILDGDETGGGMEFLGSGTLIGANIQNCLAENGGGAYAENNLTVKDSIFSHNKAIGTGNNVRGRGGGVFAGKDIIITNSTFDENESGTGNPNPSQNTTGKGGGACAFQGTVTVTDSGFTGNTSSSGGGIWAAQDVTVTNSLFSANKAFRDAGGGVFSNLTVRVQENSVFTGNEAYGGGGVNGDKVVIADSTFINNRAAGGGAVFIWTGGGEISESTFMGNTAEAAGGGAIYMDSGSGSVKIKGNNLFKDNTAAGKGGIIHSSSGSNKLDIEIDVSRGNTARFETESDTAIYSARSNIIISGDPAFLYIKGNTNAFELGSGTLDTNALMTPIGSIYDDPSESAFAAVGTPEVSLNSDDMTLTFTDLAHKDLVADSEFELAVIDSTSAGSLIFQRDGSQAAGVYINRPDIYECYFYQRISVDGGITWYLSLPVMKTLILKDGAEVPDIIFDPVLEGYNTAVITKTAHLRNSGTTLMEIENFAFDKGNYFSVRLYPGDSLPMTLYPKETFSLFIQPGKNLSPGTYSDTLIYETGAGNFSANVVFTVCEAPVVTVRPVTSTVRLGQTAVLTAAVEKGTGNFDYLWQNKDETTGQWQAIPNETGQKLTVSRNSLGQYKFRCIVTDSGQMFESNEVTVTVENQSVSESTSSESTSSKKDSDSIVFAVAFETNGGSAVKSRNVSQRGKLTQPNAPVREGYTFTGWYTDGKLTTLYDFDKAVTEAMTLYAGWEAAEKGQEEPKPAVINPAYISGYPDGTFRPDGTLTRGEAASLFYNLALQDGKAHIDLFGMFDDVNENDWYYTAVGNLAGWDIISGYEDGTFKAGETITRGELVSMTMRFAEFEQATGTADFADVPEHHWASGSIEAAVRAGFVSGYPDGSFRPDAGVTRAEAVSILNRVTGRRELSEGTAFTDVSSAHWAYEAITAAATDY